VLLATDADLTSINTDLTTHENTDAKTAHPDGINQTDLTNHKAGLSQHSIAGVTGLQTALDAKANTADLGDSAAKDVGTGPGDVAAGDAPAAAVVAHDGLSTAHGNVLPTTAEKAAMTAANSPSGGNPFATMADAGGGLHADLTDTATDGHPGTTITIAAGVEDNAVSIAADGTLKDSGTTPGGGGGDGLHASLTDTDTDGHPGTVITIAAGVEDNAVSIAADGTLQDSGTPPGGTGTTNLTNTPGVSEVTVESSSGSNTSVLGATQSLAGVMSAVDKLAHDQQLPTMNEKAAMTAASSPDGLNPFQTADDPPSAHAASHGTGQSDELTPAAIAAATAAQGALATTAVQPGDALTDLSSGAATLNHVPLAGGDGSIDWGAAPGGGGGIQEGDSVVSLGSDPQGSIGAVGTGISVAIDLGMVAYGATMSQDATITFTDANAYTSADFELTIENTATFTPSFAMAGKTVYRPEGDLPWARATAFVIGFKLRGASLYYRAAPMVAA